MAEGELKDMEQFFDDLSDSFSGTEPEVHKTSVVGMKFLWGEQRTCLLKWIVSKSHAVSEQTQWGVRTRFSTCPLPSHFDLC